MVSFFDRLALKEKEKGTDNSLLALFSTHPPSKERAARITAEGLGGKEPLTKYEWQALKNICDKDQSPTTQI